MAFDSKGKYIYSQNIIIRILMRLILYSTKVEFIFWQRSKKAFSTIIHKSKKKKVQDIVLFHLLPNCKYQNELTDLLVSKRNVQNYLYTNVAIALDVDFRITGVFDKYRKTSKTCSLVSIVFKLVVSLWTSRLLLYKTYTGWQLSFGTPWSRIFDGLRYQYYSIPSPNLL